MASPPRPEDERDRLQALDRYIANREGEAYEELAGLARYVIGADGGLLTIIDEDETWVKAGSGVGAETVDRARSFCAHLVDQPEDVMVIEDATADPRFADNRLVTEEPGIRFYAGCPIVTPDDHVIGSLCAFALEPGTLDAEQRELLSALGRQATANLVARRRVRELDDQIDARDRT